MASNIDALQLLIQVKTQGKEALAEILTATQKQTQADQQANTAGVTANNALAQAIAARVLALKNSQTAAQQAGVVMLQAINPVLAAEVQLKLAAEQAAAALLKQGQAAAGGAGSTSIWEKLTQDILGMSAATAGLSGPLTQAKTLFGDVSTGVAGGALALGSFVVAVGLAGVAAAHAAGEAGKLAEQQLNMAERTGLTIQEVGTFSGAAAVAGVNINALVTSMRTMSQTLSENSEEGKKGKQVLAELGIQAYTVTGQAKPMGALWLEIADGLSKIQNPAQRADAAIKLFGRGGLELLPLLRGNFRGLVGEVEQLGVAFTEDGAKKASEYDDKLDKLGLRWEALKRSFGEHAIGVIDIVTNLFDKDFDYDKAGANQDKPGQFYLPQGDAQDRRSRAHLSPDEVRRRQGLTPNIQSSQELLRGDLAASGQTGVNVSDNADTDSIRKQLVAQNNAAIQQVTKGLETPQAQVSQLNKDIAVLEGQLKENVFPAVNASTLRQIQQKQGQKAALEEVIKAQKELDAVNKEADRAVQSAQIAELSGLAKLKAERDAAIAQAQKLGTTGQDAVGKFKSAFDTRGNAEAQKELLKVQDSLQKGDDKGLPADLVSHKAGLGQQAGALYLQSKQGTLGLDELISKLQELNSQVQDVFIKQNWFEQNDKAAKEFTDGLAKKIAEEKRSIEELKKAWDEAAAPDRGRLEGQQKTISDTASRQIRLTQAQASPGSDYATLDTVTAIKEKAAQDEYNRAVQLAQLKFDSTEREKDEAKALDSLKRSLDDAELDRTIQIYDMRKKELEDFKQTAGKVFDAISQHGLAGLGDVFKGTLQTIERTVFTNIAGEIFKQARDTFKLGDLIGGQTDKDGKLTGLGRVLKGTPLGVDQSKAALDLNTQAHKDQTLAVTDLKAATVDLTSAIRNGGATGSGTGTPGSFVGDSGFGGEWDESSPSSSSSGGSHSGGSLISSLGKIAALAGGALGVVSGIRQGGVRGVVTAVGSAAGAAAIVDPEPISKGVLTGIALVSGLVGSLFPSKSAQFYQDQQNTLAANVYTAPTASNRTTDLYGGAVDYGYQGQVRSTAPGTIINLNMAISALDSKSVIDRSADIAGAVRKELLLGHPLGQSIQQVILQS